MNDIFFNAHHSPPGAFASFTLGYKGAKGGFGLELSSPADQSVFIGLQRKNSDSVFDAFPFYEGTGSGSERFDPEKTKNDTPQILNEFTDGKIARDFRVGSDTWHSGDLSFTIYTPVFPIPDPLSADPEELKRVITPAVLIEISVDNSRCSHPRTAFFGFTGKDPYSAMRFYKGSSEDPFTGIGQGLHIAVGTRDKGVLSGLGFSAENILTCNNEKNLSFGLGSTGLILMKVPSGEKRTFHLAAGFFRGGRATSGIDTSYYYTRFFKSVEEVVSHTLDNYEWYRKSALSSDEMTDGKGLSEDRRFLVTHAIKSYYGSTELLISEGKPVWVVNEGEYRMMNTFDLAVDQLIYEIEMNPWTVKNLLDQYVSRYSYTDKTRFPGESREYPGGISFTHDMGVSNHFTRPGTSVYELSGLDSCFSYMTHEQLVNWIICATVYCLRTGDRSWFEENRSVFGNCLRSMINRDNPDPLKRRGIMQLDSSLTEGGAEITTYDSLDPSLGQARGNVYLAVKCWAAYVLMSNLFREMGCDDLSEKSEKQASLNSATLIGSVNDEGYIPAILEEDSRQAIISAIEGLVFPWVAGLTQEVDIDGRNGNLLKVLKKHLEVILKKGTCLFDDGGWKLSSTSDNSWLSKIFLCQFVASEILKIDPGENGAVADAAHVSWLLDNRNSYYAFSDQIVKGEARASKYYPRGVTSVLWTLLPNV